MIQIRQGVFETNSSSTHSIVVQRNNQEKMFSASGYTEYADYEDGMLRLHSGNCFGWGWDILTNWLGRFAYVMAEFGEDEERREEIIASVKERLDCEVELSEHDPWWGDGDMVPDYGEIDHQSQGTLRGFLSETGVDVIDFIFDDRYIVIIDNDNNYGERHDQFISKLDIEREYWG